MPGTVQYLRVPTHLTTETPFSLVYRPGIMVGRALAPEINPLVVRPLEALYEGLIAPYEMLGLDDARPDPAFEVRLHLVRTLPAARLVAAEYVSRVAHVQVIADMMTANLAAAISAVTTSAMRFLRYRG